MLKALEAHLRELFGQSARTGAAGPSEHDLQLATAVLLIEVMRSDADFAATERAAIVNALRDKFALDSDETARLIELAETRSEAAFDFQHFTSMLNKGFSIEQKIRVVEYLWRVAYADGHLNDYEQHVMRKIADLLYIPHGDYIAAKERAKIAG